MSVSDAESFPGEDVVIFGVDFGATTRFFRVRVRFFTDARFAGVRTFDFFADGKASRLEGRWVTRRLERVLEAAGFGIFFRADFKLALARVGLRRRGLVVDVG